MLIPSKPFFFFFNKDEILPVKVQPSVGAEDRLRKGLGFWSECGADSGGPFGFLLGGLRKGYAWWRGSGVGATKLPCRHLRRDSLMLL